MTYYVKLGLAIREVSTIFYSRKEKWVLSKKNSDSNKITISYGYARYTNTCKWRWKG